MSDQEILSSLSCPVCPSYLSPPIQVCTNGHSLCRTCFERAKPQCPQCPGKFINRRCFVLERIYNKLSIPCKNRKHGCTYSAKGLQIKKHEKKCLWKYLRHRMKNRKVWMLCEIRIDANNKTKFK